MNQGPLSDRLPIHWCITLENLLFPLSFLSQGARRMNLKRKRGVKLLSLGVDQRHKDWENVWEWKTSAAFRHPRQTGRGGEWVPHYVSKMRICNGQGLHVNREWSRLVSIFHLAPTPFPNPKDQILAETDSLPNPHYRGTPFDMTAQTFFHLHQQPEETRYLVILTVSSLVFSDKKGRKVFSRRFTRRIGGMETQFLFLRREICFRQLKQGMGSIRFEVNGRCQVETTSNFQVEVCHK